MIMNRTWTLSRRERSAERRTATIICPVNFSHRDPVALRYAAQMARQRRGKLVVLHVLATEDGAALDVAGEADFENALARLEEFVPVPAGVPCEWVVLQGDVWEQIVEFAAGCDSPQIVMATGGRKNRDGFVGHTAEAVLRHAACPVVMVNDDDLAAASKDAYELRYAAV
jgi:universal stress protein A